MTPSEWLSGTDPLRLLAAVRGVATDRPLRLLACTVCRRIPGFLEYEPLRDALAAAERYTEGELDAAGLRAVWEKARLPRGEYLVYPLAVLRRHLVDALLIPRDSLGADGFFAWAARSQDYAGLVRDVIAGPAGTAGGTPAPLPERVRQWRGGLVGRLAETIAKEPGPDGTLDVGRLGLLADALLDAGCADDALMEHLRSAGPHVRGCWAVVQVLGEEPQASGGPGLGHYEVLGRLWYDGRGGGLQARDTRDGRVVTLKMSGGRADNQAERSRRRLRAEADVLAAVRHPNVERLYEVFEWDGHLCLAAEPLAANGLERVRGGWPAEQAARTVLVLARAAGAVHAAGLVHGALAPACVRLGADGELRLSGFGDSCRVGEEREQVQLAARLFGLPPERVRSGGCGPASFAEDVFALGSLLYWMLTGRGPFQGGSVFEMLERLQAGEMVPPGRVRKGAVPAALERVCLRALAARPEERYPTGLEMAAALEEVLAGADAPAPPLMPVEPAVTAVTGWRRVVRWLVQA